MSELEKCYVEIADKENMIAELETRVMCLRKFISECLDDIGNTLVANQRNLNGRHPFENEEPKEFYIGVTMVNQKGLDESLRIWNKGKRILSNQL